VGREGQVAEEAQSSIQQFLEECKADREQNDKELREIEMLIQQSSSEVDKMDRQNAEIINRLRQIENNIDTVPRSDIQNFYTAAQKAQGRLYLMRGHLEKLQDKQESLKRYNALLDEVVGICEQIGPGAVAMTRGAEITPAQSMVLRVIEAQESEKQGLARKMHDGPAQALTNLILKAEICQRLFNTNPQEAREELENLKTAVNATFQTTRAFIADLRPMMLDDLGLVPTLKRYVSTWSEQTGIPAEFTFAGKDHRLASYNEVTIFRAVQEFMSNAGQHANPSRVQVSLALEEEVARAIVEDDGVGFDVDQVLASTDAQKTVGIGIATMMERVQMLGGTLELESALGRGTKAILEIPES
jgi:two-component system sensor histidine kinase DegS